LVRWKELTNHCHLTGSRPIFQKTVLNRWITRYVHCFKQARLGMKDTTEEGLLYWLQNPPTAPRSTCTFGLLVSWATVRLRMRSASCHPVPLCHRSHAVIWRCFWKLLKKKIADTVELHLSGVIGMASHPDMQKIRIIGFFFENRLQRQVEVRLLLFTVCICF